MLIKDGGIPGVFQDTNIKFQGPRNQAKVPVFN